MSEMKWNYFRR